ncbi:hypothetical protein CRG98_013732, partial [Punica granatum]
MAGHPAQLPLQIWSSKPSSLISEPKEIIFVEKSQRRTSSLLISANYRKSSPRIGTPSHAAPRAPPTNFLPETGTEQEQRLKKLEENIRALQSGGSRLDAGDGDWSLFPDQSRRCEYHQGTPGHTTDNCWKLRERIQQMIDDKQLTFNAVKPPNVQSNPLTDHVSSSGPREYETGQEAPAPFVIEYVPVETGVGYAGFDATPAPFVIEVPAREPYQDSKVPWTYEGSVGNLESQFSVMGVTRSGRVYENPKAANKGKALAVPGIAPEASSIPQKKVTEKEAEAFMKIIKANEYKVVEQMGKSPAHISLLALLLGSEPHREALLKVLTATQIPKETAPELIKETISSIFSNNISFSDDELPSEGWAHSRALHIVCKCNNFIIGRVMIDNGSALNVCPVSTLKQMNVDFNRIRPSKTAVRAFDGSRKEVNGEIDLVIEVGPCSFAVTFQVLDIPNAFNLLLGRPWIHAAGAVHSEPVDLPNICAVTEETTPGAYIRFAQENEELNNRTSVPRYSTVIADVLHSILSLRRVDSNPSEELLEGSRPIYFGEGLNEDGRVPEIEESLRHLENRQLISVEPTEEINVGTEEEPRIQKIGTGLDPTQRARMIEFLKDYQEINAGFLEVCNYSDWVANIVLVEKKDGRVRVCIDYRDLNKASPKDNFPLPHIDVLVDNTARHTLFSFMDGFSGYNQIWMAEEDKIKTKFIT